MAHREVSHAEDLAKIRRDPEGLWDPLSTMEFAVCHVAGADNAGSGLRTTSYPLAPGQPQESASQKKQSQQIFQAANKMSRREIGARDVQSFVSRAHNHLRVLPGAPHVDLACRLHPLVAGCAQNRRSLCAKKTSNHLFGLHHFFQPLSKLNIAENVDRDLPRWQGKRLASSVSPVVAAMVVHMHCASSLPGGVLFPREPTVADKLPLASLSSATLAIRVLARALQRRTHSCAIYRILAHSCDNHQLAQSTTGPAMTPSPTFIRYVTAAECQLDHAGPRL